MNSREEKYRHAKERVEAERSFYGHFFLYLIINTGIFILDYVQGGPSWWYWPAIGWGIGLASHGLSVFGLNLVLGKKWEERRMRQLMENDNDHNG